MCMPPPLPYIPQWTKFEIQFESGTEFKNRDMLGGLYKLRFLPFSALVAVNHEVLFVDVEAVLVAREALF